MRTLARQMAHIQMELRGISKPNHVREKDTRSFFARNWMAYAVTPKAVKTACAKERQKQQERKARRNEART